MLFVTGFLILTGAPLASALVGVAAFRPRGQVGPVLTAWVGGVLVTIGVAAVAWLPISTLASALVQLVVLGLTLGLGLTGGPFLLVRAIARADARAASRRDVAAFD